MRFFVKNKLLTLILLGVISLIGYEMYVSQAKGTLNRDTNTYLEVIKGIGFINRDSEKIGPLKVSDEKVQLFEGDKVSSFGKMSILLITWGDGSITRLGGNSSIVVNKNYVDNGRSTINIDFDLKKGKSWSNVVSTMGNDSYFNQRFETYVAGVRGTVYNVDLTNSFVSVNDHEVNLTDIATNKSFVVKEGDIFSLDLIDYIHDKAKKKIFETLDAGWVELNKAYDSEYIKKLREEVALYLEKAKELPGSFLAFMDDKKAALKDIYAGKMDLASVGGLSKEDIDDVYSSAYSRLQNLNFVKSDDIELFKEKLKLKEFLSKLDPKNNDLLMRTATYDLKDAVESGNKEAVSTITNFFASANFDKGELKKVLEDNFKGVMNNASELGDIMMNNLKGLELDFKIDNVVSGAKDVIDNAGELADDIKNKASHLHDDAKDAVKNTLDKIFDFK